MWNKFNIKTQLFMFVSLIIILIEVVTLFLVLDIHKKEHKENILNEENAIARSLNNDFLEYILSSNADMLSNINFRLSAFKKVDSVMLFNEKSEALYKYKQTANILNNFNTILKEKALFKDDKLFIKNDIKSDNFPFGFIIVEINLEDYKQKEMNITYAILSVFPLALILGFILSLYLSRSFTKPFIKLIETMKKSEPSKNKIIKIETKANNEIKELFDGFNKQMQQIADSSKKLQYVATHDSLTNIYNRFFIENELKELLKEEKDNSYALIYIDLDQFKLINDSVGSETADELLKMITEYYKNILPPDSTFARIDGDEFMLTLKNHTPDEAEEFLKKSLEYLKDFRFSNESETYSISASISLVHFKACEFTLKELLKASSQAMKTAKNKGKNKSHIYNSSDEFIKRVTIEQESAKLIREALLGNKETKFELFAQDIVPLQNKDTKYSYEILLRMKDDEGNYISPGDFLPAAERYQLMDEIDAHVFTTYLETTSKDKKHIDNLHKVHINLAGSSLNNIDFQTKVKEAIKKFDFPWEKLELEVTESSAIGSFNKANEFISYLKSKKIGLALDDFGTGMASFDYLKNLPFDTVKIDGSFIKDMHDDPIDKAVIKYIQEIANLKKQETVAEYVETKKDVEELTKLGVTYGQGFYLGKPRALKEWLN